jgi:hypothetical protein
MSDLVEIFVTEIAEEVTLNVTPNLIEVNVIKGVAPTNPITGSGTVNRIPKFTGGSTLGNSLIFDNGTNVGIGTTSPSVNLQVTNTSGELFRLTNTTGAERLHFYTRNSASNSRIGSQNSSLQLFSDDVGFDLILGTSNTERMRITPTGNVGIGTTAPTSRLHVTGLQNFADNAAAIAGGLTVGAFYHTSGTLKVVI